MADFLKAAGDILASIAPTVATALGGPFAGLATQKLISALGLAPDAPTDTVMQAVAGATPEQMLKLKEVEQAFKVEMKKLDIDIMKLQVEDTVSARQREIATADWTPRVIASLIIGLYITVQWYLLGNVIDATMREIVLRSLGTLDASLGLVLGYYFGSSVGSRTKDATINNLQK
jgi:hypothetical protein